LNEKIAALGLVQNEIETLEEDWLWASSEREKLRIDLGKDSGDHQT